MPIELDAQRAAARPTVDLKMSLAASLTELPDGGGFVVDILANGVGAPVPLKAIAYLTKGSDFIEGEFPGSGLGDAVSGEGIAAGVKVLESTRTGLKLSKAVAAEGEIEVTVTPATPAVKLCSIPISVNSANDPALGTVLEFAVRMLSSVGDRVLGSAQLTLDTELTFNRIPRK